MANKNQKGHGAIIFLGCSALFVVGLLSIFDGLFFSAALRERAARSHWEQIPAVVTVSKVDVKHGSESSSYTPKIHFRYRIDGKDYTGKQYSFISNFSAGEDYAERATSRFPKGAEVTAYVNPDDTSEAVLTVDGSAFPKLALLLLTPFHCIAFGIIAGLVGAIRRRKSGGDRSDLEVKYVHYSDQHHFVMRKRPLSPVGCFLGFLGLISFFATFAVGLSGADQLAPYVLGASVLGAAALTRHFAKKSARPENFLHVDREGRTFAYPADAEPIGFTDRNVIEVNSEATSVTINDQKIYRHEIRIGEGTNVAPMFRFKGPIQEGEELRGLIERELNRAAAAAAA